jgi:hypothetical protein
MRCLGIDIGLKNLALCVVEYDVIKLWNVYNILEDESVCFKCTRKAKYTFEDIVYCGIHSRKLKHKKEVKYKKIASYSLQELSLKIIKSFEQIIHDNKEILEDVSSVVLELQPNMNPKMKFTSHVLFTLLAKFYTDKKCSIKFERASVKLKKYKSAVYIKNTYANRKKRAIEYTTRILNNDIKNKEDYRHIVESKKADDLCDAFLLSYKFKK